MKHFGWFIRGDLIPEITKVLDWLLEQNWGGSVTQREISNHRKTLPTGTGQAKRKVG